MTGLDRLVGAWTTELTHPALPGVVARGIAEVEWLEGQQFLIHRARIDHPDFPDSISILGCTGRDRADASVARASPLSLHYFDSRGVSRVYGASVDDSAWQLWSNAVGFAQRFTGTFTDGGDTIAGMWQLCTDGVAWNDDLRITYRRRR